VNDEKVVSHKLSHGDNIVIASTSSSSFHGKTNAGRRTEGQEAALDKTMLLDTARQRELLAKQKVAPRPPNP